MEALFREIGAELRHLLRGQFKKLRAVASDESDPSESVPSGGDMIRQRSLHVRGSITYGGVGKNFYIGKISGFHDRICFTFIGLAHQQTESIFCHTKSYYKRIEIV